MRIIKIYPKGSDESQNFWQKIEEWYIIVYTGTEKKRNCTPSASIIYTERLEKNKRTYFSTSQDEKIAMPDQGGRQYNSIKK